MKAHLYSLSLVRSRIRAAAALFTVAIGTGAFAASLDTQFWYDGLLNYNGKPANGNFDFQARLFDDPNNSNNQISTNFIVPNVSLVNGLSHFSLDFGPVFDGTKLWLDLQVRPSGGQSWQALSPRMLLTASPYALFAPTSAVANSVANNGVTGGAIQSGVVVKSLNGLHDAVNLQPGSGISLTPNGNTLTIDSSGGGWSLMGNSGTSPGVNFLGTTDGNPLELSVYNHRALRLEYGLTQLNQHYSMNVIGGFEANVVSGLAQGATIGGGGGYDVNSNPKINEVSESWGTIGGGSDNHVGGLYGAIPGGVGNHADGYGSFAAGQKAHAVHAGSFVWSDGQSASSSGPSSFDVFARGGMTLTSPRGIDVTSASTIISGGWDPFDVTAPAAKTGLGRWGLFMEVPGIVLGMPATDVGYKTIAFGRYNPDGTYDELMSLQNTDARAWFLGQVSCCSVEIRGGCDVAEPFPMNGDHLPKGAVVVIDEEHPGQLKLSDQPYDTRVAGIISGANGISPGIALHQEGKLDVGQNVALSGRVYVLADATTGPILPGDLLTTSATPGHAMKVRDHGRAQGAILGKAMSGLKEGVGTVLTLVTLQ